MCKAISSGGDLTLSTAVRCKIHSAAVLFCILFNREQMFEKWLHLQCWYDKISTNKCSGGDTMLIQENLTIEEKLKILTDAAKYDVACTSSGVERKGKKGHLGNSSEAGICHSFAADGRCISLLKILFTNQCIYDCKYCVNRCSNDTLRTAFTPDEVCTLTMEFYRRNYIEGLFLSSGILSTADHTMELIYETLYKLRNVYHFNGYIHVKSIPGASGELVERLGFLADRMSINLELPTAAGLRELAPGKTREKILSPMRQVQQGIALSGRLLGYDRGYRKLYPSERAGFAGGASLIRPELTQKDSLLLSNRTDHSVPALTERKYGTKAFVPAGQSTQMIVGATPENDFQMLSVTQALYRNFGLKRVFYSAYVPVNDDSHLPSLPGGPPLLREHRLYQADWLLRFYGFKAEELLSEKRPNFNLFLDPKCDWALQNLKDFPVEINKASYEQLLRVPGVGVKSARRIIAARKQGKLDFDGLKRMGVVLKRARYFITCSGKMEVSFRMDEDSITSALIGDERRKVWDIENRDSYRQLSLFDDMHLEEEKTAGFKEQLVKEAVKSAVFGQM